ncbi:O-methyltransferase [Paenibacillus yanchengensis]|uniref:O-methyltransferase n=1 Tax=Paenibacillus yanchengensis TaxID=2035833 RepID=A0ABW4YP11_9BACL
MLNIKCSGVDELEQQEREELYIAQLYKEDEQLKMVRAGIVAAGLRDISVPIGYGRLLTMLVQLNNAQRVLEIGALGGYSGICLARGFTSTSGQLVSLELHQTNADLASRHMSLTGFDQQVTYMVGDARDSLQQLLLEDEQFDFFFIDADKEGYPFYLDVALKLARPGAIIVADNIFLRGRVLDESKQGPAVQAMRQFNERIASDPRLLSTSLPGYDGLTIAIVKK